MSHEEALGKARAEYEVFRASLDAAPSPVERHFREAVEDAKQLEAGRKRP